MNSIKLTGVLQAGLVRVNEITNKLDIPKLNWFAIHPILHTVENIRQGKQ